MEASKEIDEDGIKQEKIELDLSTSFKTALCDCNVDKKDCLSELYNLYLDFHLTWVVGKTKRNT